eukprot:COSAG02_NODE_47809_length_338_cov_1.066946_1_plen_20_part_01
MVAPKVQVQMSHLVLSREIN